MDQTNPTADANSNPPPKATPPPPPPRGTKPRGPSRQNSIVDRPAISIPHPSEARASFVPQCSDLEDQIIKIRANSVIREEYEPGSNEPASPNGKSAPPPLPSKLPSDTFSQKVAMVKALPMKPFSDTASISRSNSVISITPSAAPMSRAESKALAILGEEKGSVSMILIYTPPIEKFPQHRDKVARELFTTEQTYVKSLTFLQREYIMSMEEWLNPKDIYTIFSCITQILKVNEELLKKLHEKIENWTDQTTLSDALQSLIPFLKMYTQYCVGFDDAIKKIAELEKQNPRFAQYIIEAKSLEGANGLDLRSFLIMPVQRIPRYTLLLGDFIKHTSNEHPDYEGLNKALEQVKIVAARVNEAIHEQDNRNRILAIQQRFNGEITLVDSHRRFVKEGTLVKSCRKEDKKRLFFLFNDMLIYGQRVPDGSLKLSQQINMNDLSIADDTSSGYFGFTIRSLKKSFVVKTDSQSEKEAWMKSINDTLAEFKRSLRSKNVDDVEHAPVWKQDSTTTTCKFCDTKFTWTNRRHHCRKCGEVVCGNCSTRKLNVSGTPSRVCDPCFDSNHGVPASVLQSSGNSSAATSSPVPSSAAVAMTESNGSCAPGE